MRLGPKDIEYPVPKFSRSEIASVFGLHPIPPPDSAAQPAPKKRPLNAGGRPPKTNWHPIDMYIVAIVSTTSFPENPKSSFRDNGPGCGIRRRHIQGRGARTVKQIQAE